MSGRVVGRADAFEDGDRVVVEVDGKEVGVFKHDGEFYAYLNWCPHQGGPVCEGWLAGRRTASFDRDRLETALSWTPGGTLVCPWHDWEFDVTTGECFSDRDVSLPAYPVRVEDGAVTVVVD